MTIADREPGTYKTRSGALVHFRPAPDGRVVAETETTYGRLGGEDDLVKLSDDPNWPDLERRPTDPLFFAD